LPGLLLLFAGNYAIAQPTPRASAQLFYVKSTQSLVLLDGYEKGTMPASGKAETWAWKNNSWTKLDETDQPLRSLGAAAYLTKPGSIFVVGGVGSRGYDDSLKDAYSYDGSRWSAAPGIGLGTRDHHEMVYDENSQRLVLYGGQTGSREFDTRTWTYKTGVWTPLNIPGPGGRVHHAMAYDAERKKTVLFGGSGPDRSFDETWEFDGKQWSKIETPTNPGQRTHHAMVYDPLRKKVLLYGGGIGMELQSDIWAWDGKTWEKLSSGGPARILAAMAFNPSNNKLYVFGGNGGQQMMSIYSDLWEWDGQDWKQVDKGKVYQWDNSKDSFVEKK
jgi:N-acetylneuraminic acid mutarotase